VVEPAGEVDSVADRIEKERDVIRRPAYDETATDHQRRKCSIATCHVQYGAGWGSHQFRLNSHKLINQHSILNCFTACLQREGCGICRLIHIVILCLNYLMHYPCMMQSVNECCLSFRSVLIVTVTWFRLVLGTQFYMAVCHLP